MDEFPAFMRQAANRIAGGEEATPGGHVFDAVDGRRMAFWTCHETASSAAHAHEFDEYMLVVQGCYILPIGGERIPVRAGEEYFLPRGTVHSGEVCGGDADDPRVRRTARESRRMTNAAVVA
jgi:mannose-6-phosphate isomerase-like protein (cupin superfamily)